MSLDLQLVRDYQDDAVTLGTLTAPSGRKWQTLERPWIPFLGAPCGTKGVSCIPAGTYRLEPHNSDAHANVWALVNAMLWVYHWDADVPVGPQDGTARTTVLVHPANWASELRGCIAPGKARFKQPNGVWMVQQSRDAVNELRGAVNGSYDLTITVTYATGVGS